ncbi:MULTISPECIES: hypothetical protein [unclassified Streptomyces]|nr:MULTISPECIES: hypothetical protein [unclassified Streptomyces]
MSPKSRPPHLDVHSGERGGGERDLDGPEGPADDRRDPPAH